MSIFVDENTTVLVQGLTGGQGRFHGLRNKAYGTLVVGGTNPKRGGEDIEGIPVYATVKEAVDATGATNETADPRGQSSLRSSMDLPRNVQLDAAVRWVDALHINNGPTGGPVVGIVPSYFEFDTRIAWHVTKKLELSIVGQNLLHDHHPEYGYPSPSREEIERTVFGKISWGY